MALIIIEGPDRTGKSSLAEILASELTAIDGKPTATLHFGPPQESAWKEYVESLEGFDLTSCHVVCDRHWLGEKVWPDLFGRAPRMTDLDAQAIESWLLSQGAVLVLCHRPLADLVRAHRESVPPEPLPTEKVPDAYVRFWREYHRVNLSKCVYDHGLSNSFKLAKQTAVAALELRRVVDIAARAVMS